MQKVLRLSALGRGQGKNCGFAESECATYKFVDVRFLADLSA